MSWLVFFAIALFVSVLSSGWFIIACEATNLITKARANDEQMPDQPFFRAFIITMAMGIPTWLSRYFILQHLSGRDRIFAGLLSILVLSLVQAEIVRRLAPAPTYRRALLAVFFWVLGLALAYFVIYSIILSPIALLVFLGILVVALIEATFLRAAIMIQNLLVGRESSRAVPPLDFTGAYTITLAAYLAHGALCLVLLLFPKTKMPLLNLGGTGMAEYLNPSIAQVVGLVSGWLVMTVMIHWLLPTSMRRGLMLATIKYAMSIALIAAIVISARMTGAFE